MSRPLLRTLHNSRLTRPATTLSFLWFTKKPSTSPANMSTTSTSDPSAPPKIEKSESEWRATLTPTQFRILRQSGTEPPFTGEYDSHYPKKGTYACAGCGTELYTAETKFKSGCGWPAFFDAIPGRVERREDKTLGMTRTEILCRACGGHLGHVFKGEGLGTPTDERHCVNSVSLRFLEDEGRKEEKL